MSSVSDKAQSTLKDGIIRSIEEIRDGIVALTSLNLGSQDEIGFLARIFLRRDRNRNWHD
jgi:hypothetical protein